jgi:hypothetical protein
MNLFTFFFNFVLLIINFMKNSTQLNSTQLSTRTKIGILIFCVMIIAMVVQSFSLNMNNLSNPTNYAELPPDLEKFTIQKLTTPLSEGENVIIRPTLTHFDSMPQTLFLFTGQDSFAFSDDGVYPDNEAGDHEYAAFFKIDLDDFLLQVENRENELETMEQFIVFEGHEGHFEDSITPFDFTGFAAFQEVEVQANLILADQCDGSLLKQNSLFITDLEVVEDDDRTYCAADGTGTPNGIWTFSKFMTNMANTSVTGVSTSDFIKNWLKYYLQNISNPNGFDLPRQNQRDFILDILIRPWIHKANGVTDVEDFLNSSGDFIITPSNWEAAWDAANDAELIKNAPFKLTAIANRIDLRNNVAFTNKITRAGETRFIFTAINLYNIDELPGDLAIGNPGKVPLNNLNNNSFQDFIDWKGMNVIFEFGNVQTNLCDLKSFAQAWVDLSELGLGTATYNAALEDITETVINANVASGKPNGSALNQFRTNEKIFFNTVGNSLNDGPVWNNSSWQFRQFEINATTHQLTLVPLSNTPMVEDFNASKTSTFNNQNNRPANLGSYLTDWLYKNKERVKRENFIIPETFYVPTISTTYSFLDKTGDIDAEYPFFWDLSYSNTPYFSSTNELVSGNTQNKDNGKEIRQKFSLNTCQGCHSGETKTFFTMVSPLNKGESARYWLTTPDTKAGQLDVRNTTEVKVPKNFGTTVLGDPNTAPSADRFPNYPVPTANSREYVTVSAFITGRTYDGTSFEDDEPDNFNKEPLGPDHEMIGLYYVNDPSNVYDPNNQTNAVNNNFGHNDKRTGFNELQRRKKDLCDLIGINCSNPNSSYDGDIFDLIKNLMLLPILE